MAYRPSLRRHRQSESTDLNLTPIMNLMVVMIPLLLSSAQFIKIGVIELNLPPSAGAVGLAGAKPTETARTLDLTISITEKGFYLSTSSAVLQRQPGSGPSIPLKETGEYDFAALSRQLYEIKNKSAEYSDTDAVVIQAENRVLYQILVSTMDAARSISIDGRPVVLFPQVSLSAGVI